MTRKILIVDDSKLARMAVARALESLHPEWTRLEAPDAESALEAVRRESPDVALLDFNMPGKDGIMLAAELLSIHPGMQAAVISANHQVEVINRARAAGAAFLRKPISTGALGEFLDAAVEPQQDLS